MFRKKPERVYGKLDVKAEYGTREKLRNDRAEALSEVNENIKKILDGYDGGAIAILIVKEDQDYHAEGIQAMISGVASDVAYKALEFGLRAAADNVKETRKRVSKENHA